MFKLSTQATSPTGDEEDSIAKVLDWFSRSSDSSDWLNANDSTEATKSSDKHVDVKKMQHEDSLRNDDGVLIRPETLDIKRSHLQRQNNEAKEVRATDTMGNNGLPETEEEVMKDVGERMRSEEVKDNGDEWQPLKISRLKSFWEKNNTGPKIITSKSITPSNKEQKPIHHPAGKGEENNRVSGMPSGICTEDGIYDKYASNGVDKREQLVVSPQTGSRDGVQLNINQQENHLLINASTQKSNHGPTHNLKLPPSAQEEDTRLDPQPRTVVQPRLSSESQSFSSVKLNQQPHSISQFQEPPQQDEVPKTNTVPQLDVALQTMDSPHSEKVSLSRNSSCVDHRQGEDDARLTSKANMCRSSSEDMERRDSKGKGPHFNTQDLPEESTAEKIKKLRSFWEQERNKPFSHAGKPKTPGAGNHAYLNKRFTKSEYDLTSIGNYSDDDAEDSSTTPHNFTILPLNQRIETVSPSLNMSRTQFNTLREFWDASVTKGSPSKPKTPKRKESTSVQVPCQELPCGLLEVYCVTSNVEKTRPASIKTFPPPLNRSKSPHDRQTGSGSRASSDSKSSQSSYTKTEFNSPSKDSNREEKPTKPRISSGKETRSPKGRRDSFGNSSARNSLRRAKSMFALSAPDEKDQYQLPLDVSPVQSQSRRERQSTDKTAVLRRPSAETETHTPRARAFVPRDFRHYLGMTDQRPQTSIHASLTPAAEDEGPEATSGYEFDPSPVSPVRASTPVSSDERYNRNGSKTSQRPLWANYSSSDTGQESSVSSTSETWSVSRNSSNREHQFLSKI